ncbi:MAG: elongation factor G [Oscillospiraceae bacterium]|jgi:elongation factor G|nr:elongation factor G [Oscillospiraceae bacterium]
MTGEIKNISVLGHGGDGKTTLCENILFLTKSADRQGKVADGNTVSDFDPEETRRQISIAASVLPVEHGGVKLNLLDTPGYFDFIGEQLQALSVTDTGLICLSGKSGPGVGTEKAYKMLAERKMAKFFYISKMDEENADFAAALARLRELFGHSVCPVNMPVFTDGKLTGVASAADSPEYGAMLREAIAETSEALMEKFFSDEPFTPDEQNAGIREGLKSGALCPVFCGSAVTGVGTKELLDSLAALAPSPSASPSDPLRLFVFKTVSDQFGKFSFFKVCGGTLASDTQLTNARTGDTEKLAHIYMVRGKKNTEVKTIACGDIGAVSKLTDTKTCDTLCAPAAAAEALPPIAFPKPCYSLAVFPKVKGGEEKISSGLLRMSEEDMTFTMKNDPEIRQMVVTGQGDIHIDVLCSRLKNRFGVEVDTEAPRVPYREKIRKKVTGVEGKHKKQTGGHGQFGRVIMEFEPSDSDDLTFEEKIFGGAVPKQYIPAVEKGLRDCIQKGVLAGFPVVCLKATLVDGSYHDVDSSEMAFKLAARLAYKAGLPQASPVLLEPVGTLRVNIPDSHMGDIIGDLNKRRGRVMGMNPGAEGQVVEAEVPMAEMATYAIDLRSMTSGRGSFDFTFARYEEAPAPVQQKVINEYKAAAEEEED